MNSDYAAQWQNALEQIAHGWPKPKIIKQAIELPGFDAKQLAEGLVRVDELLTNLAQSGQTISLRTLSARCFNGHSKVLDTKRAFLEHAFPLAKAVIEDRVIMLSAYIPERLDAVLFVENFDSFRTTVRAVKNCHWKNNLAVIYSAGYRGSAGQIRDPKVTQFVTINQANKTAYQAFHDWWYLRTTSEKPCFFWGDLDYEGLGIIKSLRRTFPTTRCWSTAFEAMIVHLDAGVAHKKEHATKKGQINPGSTGCDFSDSRLLALIEDDDLFVDQEVLCYDEVSRALAQSDFLEG